MTPEDLILMHGSAPYDPAKRREYYLKTRQLKGRKRGSSDEPVPTPSARRSSSGLSVTAQQIKQLQGRLDELRTKLKALQGQTSDNKKSSDSKESSSSKKGGGKPTDRKSLTAEQKRDAAKRSEEWRKKNKDKTEETKSTPTVEELKAKIQEIREKIEVLRAAMNKSSQRKAVDTNRKENSQNGS